MDFRTIRYEQLGAVVRITANRPEVLNAQSRVMLVELDEAFRAASEDDATRAIIVAGAGPHFSAGHDLGSPDEIEDQKAHPVGPGIAENLKRLSELYLETCLRWRDVPKPTIAQVQGYCIMGGLMLASCCDLIIAADNARFGQPEINLGILPGWGGSIRLARTTTLGYAKELIYTGRTVDAAEALERGLVNAVYEPGELAAKTRDLCDVLVAKSPLALAYAKEATNHALQGPHRTNLETEARLFAMMFSSEDQKEGMAAFVEKREPRFSGR